jgi:hypothetical protein
MIMYSAVFVPSSIVTPYVPLARREPSSVMIEANTKELAVEVILVASDVMRCATPDGITDGILDSSSIL